jgi:hypothetical protein
MYMYVCIYIYTHELINACKCHIVVKENVWLAMVLKII